MPRWGRRGADRGRGDAGLALSPCPAVCRSIYPAVLREATWCVDVQPCRGRGDGRRIQDDSDDGSRLHVLKWFARCLGSVFRALLVGATSEPDSNFQKLYYGEADLRNVIVLYPFGGGEVAKGKLKNGRKGYGSEDYQIMVLWKPRYPATPVSKTRTDGRLAHRFILRRTHLEERQFEHRTDRNVPSRLPRYPRGGSTAQGCREKPPCVTGEYERPCEEDAHPFARPAFRIPDLWRCAI